MPSLSLWPGLKLVSSVVVILLLHRYVLLHFVHKYLSRFKGRDVVGGDDDGGVLGYVTAGLLRPLFGYKAAETPEIHALPFTDRLFHGIHKGFNGCLNRYLLYACFL